MTMFQIQRHVTNKCRRIYLVFMQFALLLQNHTESKIVLSFSTTRSFLLHIPLVQKFTRKGYH